MVALDFDDYIWLNIINKVINFCYRIMNYTYNSFKKMCFIIIMQSRFHFSIIKNKQFYNFF
jgi:hypothetical protein